ncbi:MAG: Panacea domain-containing protein [Candidatus Symbiobacter sp.]|nr:Panacea domain-containing protein [Candidatus Symbiobacter sp.]
MFSEFKAAQMAAFFLDQAPGQRMPHLKLMKLLYLSDREAIRVLGYPISYDQPVAMRNGPVLSYILDLMDGDIESQPNGWEDWISAKENHEIALRKTIKREDLGKLSDAVIDVMQSIWDKFGKMNQWQIRDWTHKHCAEWRDPSGSSCPIKFEDIAKAVGYDSDTAKEVADDIREDFAIDRVFKSLRPST